MANADKKDEDRGLQLMRVAVMAQLLAMLLTFILAGGACLMTGPSIGPSVTLTREPDPKPDTQEDEDWSQTQGLIPLIFMPN